MFYLAYVLVGIFTVFSWSIFFYLVKPNAFIIIENSQVLSRWKILLHWFVISLIIFIVLCLIIPSEQAVSERGVPMFALSLGMIISIVGLFLLGKSKINIDTNKKAGNQIKEDWEKLKKDWNDIKSKKDVQLIKKTKTPQTVVISPKEPTPHVSSKEPIYQPLNQAPDFEKDDDILDDLDLVGFRYVLDYKDKYGNVTSRGVDILGVHKEYGNNRWYFIADTIDGERTFKSQRVISLKDQWFNNKYNSSKAIREHLLSEYNVIEDVED